jgi:hypothetical protein
LSSPASWIAPPKSSNFSIKVVLPASGCEVIAKVRRRAISSVRYVRVVQEPPRLEAQNGGFGSSQALRTFF